MTDCVNWFRGQLASSAEGFVWSFEQIEPALHLGVPPDARYLGLWPPARHVWHVAEYERCLVVPSMQQWLGGALPAGDDISPDSDETWATVQDRPAETFIESFQTIRAAQIKLLDDLSAFDWDARNHLGHDTAVDGRHQNPSTHF